jgi:hypothetical protein
VEVLQLVVVGQVRGDEVDLMSGPDDVLGQAVAQVAHVSREGVRDDDDLHVQSPRSRTRMVRPVTTSISGISPIALARSAPRRKVSRPSFPRESRNRL